MPGKRGKPGLLTYREYALHRKERGLSGTTHQAVGGAIRRGRLELAVRDGLIDPKVADQEWADNMREMPAPEREGTYSEMVQDPRSDPLGGLSKAAVERLLAGVKLEKNRLELSAIKGRLVDIESMREQEFAFAHGYQEKIKSMPSELVRQMNKDGVVDAKTSVVIEALATQIIEVVLEQLANELQKKWRNPKGAGSGN